MTNKSQIHHTLRQWLEKGGRLCTPTQLRSGLRSTPYVKTFRMSVQLCLISLSLFLFFVVICFFLLQHSLKTPEDVLRRPQIRRCYRKNDRASLLSLTAVNQPVMIDYFQRCSRGCTPPLLGNCQKKNSAEIFSLFEMEESLRQSGCHGPVLVS